MSSLSLILHNMSTLATDRVLKCKETDAAAAAT